VDFVLLLSWRGDSLSVTALSPMRVFPTIVADDILPYPYNER